MPNNVTNRLEIKASPEKVKKVLDFIKPKKPREDFDIIDFSNIIPMPDMKDEKKREWGYANWNTKWNAYKQHLDGDVVWFDTAWNPPTPVIEELAALFPECVFVHTWADEDASYNLGRVTYSIEGDTHEHIEEGTKEAYELYFELHPDARGDYELVDGNYKMIEE